jgi:ethanolamine ammonia-lyase small subunit
LDVGSKEVLANVEAGWDVVFVVADGLSATAVNQHATDLLRGVIPELKHDEWRVGPIVVVEQGRVAIGDEIAGMLSADMVVVLIGERPGLSSADSLGVYITWQPRPETRDSERNCVSAIRPGGCRSRQPPFVFSTLCVSPGDCEYPAFC